MNPKDKQIVKDSVMVAADALAASLGIGVAWSLSKALFGAGMKLRQQRALEWVEMVRDHPDVFTQQLIEQEDFQDGFVFSLERYLIERSEEKRQYFRNIFLGYAQTDARGDFLLERFVHTLSQLSEADIAVLRDVDIARDDKNYQIYGDTDKNLTSIFNLITLGILHNDPSPRIGPLVGPFVWVSDFGKQFVKYITE